MNLADAIRQAARLSDTSPFAAQPTATPAEVTAPAAPATIAVAPAMVVTPPVVTPQVLEPQVLESMPVEAPVVVVPAAFAPAPEVEIPAVAVKPVAANIPPVHSEEPVVPAATQPAEPPRDREPILSFVESTSSKDSVTAELTTTNVVRLELVLNPEQLNGLFRAITANQHSVLTLREAAAFLRLPLQTVEQLANDKKIPGLLIDGKWRFTHAALEEWFGLNTMRDSASETARGA